MFLILLYIFENRCVIKNETLKVRERQKQLKNEINDFLFIFSCLFMRNSCMRIQVSAEMACV